MRITTTDGYHFKKRCPCGFDECERFYCPTHRLLWTFCDTAKAGTEGDRDVIGGTHTIYETGDCPKCERESEHRKIYRELLRDHPEMSICPLCFEMNEKPDEIAVHLVDYHEWETDEATVWLRKQVEEKSFYEEP
jgi:hypothetical protein